MDISIDLKNRLKLINNTNITDDAFKKLLENSFAFLIKNQEVHSIATLCSSKPDLIKNVYAAMLTINSEFGRHDLTKEDVKTFLTNDCNFNSSRSTIYSEMYDKNKQPLQIILGNIGTHLPHLTEVQWKIDYIVKTSNLNQSDGPLFRISLISEKKVEDYSSAPVNRIEFSCTSQELQDLVYKLKDAVRHCQRITTDS